MHHDVSDRLVAESLKLRTAPVIGNAGVVEVAQDDCAGVLLGMARGSMS